MNAHLLKRRHHHLDPEALGVLPGTTIHSIAEWAGVAVPAVYATFGTKRELLRQLIEATIVDDEDPLSITHRPQSLALAAEPDPRRRASSTPP